MSETKIYPTTPDADGFFFNSEAEEQTQVLTKEYPNGSIVKRVELSKGKIAVIRQLKGRDFVETKKRMKGDNESDFETVNMSIATKIDDKQHPPEYYLDDISQADYSKILIAYGTLNF